MSGGVTGHEGLEVRSWRREDIPDVVDLVRGGSNLPPDKDHESYFRWKHFENPFGPSPGWLAIDAGRVVGIRTFVRWQFDRAGRPVRAVRAVDTYVHPGWQRRGIFSELTRRAVTELRDEGVDLIFNTPNDKSLPGYLKLGWEVVGRLPVAFRARSLPALTRVVRSRTAAERWSLPSEAGVPVAEALDERAALDRLLASQPLNPRLTTKRSLEYLAWRYGLPLLQYRAVLAGSSVDDGVAIFRLRRRGRAVEAAVCETIVPGGSRPAMSVLAGRAARASGADYAIVLGPAEARGAGFLPLPGQGPVLTCLPLSGGEVPAPEVWNLTLGDVELL